MASALQLTDTDTRDTVQKFKDRQKLKLRAEQIRVERQMTKDRAEQIWMQMEDELPLCVVDSFTPILQMQDEIPLWVSSQTEEETDLKQAEEKTTDGHEHEGGEEHTEAAHDARFRISLVDKEGLDRDLEQTQTEKKQE